MNDEVKEILDKIIEVSNVDDYEDCFIGTEFKPLINYIASLQNELKFQKEQEKDYFEKHTKLLHDFTNLQEEIERLNNIINSLEQEMNEELKIKISGEDFWRGYDDCLKDFLQRLKELKQEN